MTDLQITRKVQIPDSELRESFSRSSGPGGQNVNKLATKVELRWVPATSVALSEVDREYLLKRLATRLTASGELIVTCEEHRTQARNREEARAKLATLIRDALVRPKKRRPTKPSKGSVKRRLEGKSRRSSIKKGRGRGGMDD